VAEVFNFGCRERRARKVKTRRRVALELLYFNQQQPKLQTSATETAVSAIIDLSSRRTYAV
jgi:hypothetical protein